MIPIKIEERRSTIEYEIARSINAKETKESGIELRECSCLMKTQVEQWRVRNKEEPHTGYPNWALLSERRLSHVVGGRRNNTNK